MPVSDFVKNHNVDFRSDDVERKIKEYVRSESKIQPFGSVAEQLLGDTIASNILMLGYVWQMGGLPISLDAIQQAISLNGVAVDKNLKAFEVGRTLQVDAARVIGLLQSKQARGIDDMSVEQLVEHRAAHLRNYQGNRLAKRYLAAVDRFKSLCQSANLDTSIVRAVADNYARLLAYKDEYEVARLYSSPEFNEMIDQQFDGDFKLSFNLAPPLISKMGPLGRPKKREFGRSILTVFKLLQRAKGLRGTPFDVFGYTAERRAERGWIKTYEQDMQTLLDKLGQRTSNMPNNKPSLDAAEAILVIPAIIKGYGPIKLQAMEEASVARELAWQQFNSPDTLSSVNQAA